MEHAAYQVDILDGEGRIIGSKRRHDIDKNADIFHVIYILLITPEGQLVLTPVIERKNLPNLFVGQLSLTVATIRRTGEKSEAAAYRAVARELFIEDPELEFIGEELMTFNGISRFVSVFTLIGEPPHVYSKTDIDKLVIISPRELAKRIREAPEEFAPPLLAIWEKWQERFPV